jgi:RHS repeat-associated protein
MNECYRHRAVELVRRQWAACHATHLGGWHRQLHRLCLRAGGTPVQCCWNEHGQYLLRQRGWGHLIGEQRGTSTKTTTFLLTDLLGSVVASFSTTSGSAAVQGNRAYSPYGAPLYQQGSVGTSRGFTGQYADSTSGLDYYNARSYDPLVGQFVSADSVQGNLGGMDPYAYVGGNPETWTDPTGLVATGACGVACTGKSSTSPAGSYDLGAGPCGLSVFGICILPETPPQVSRCDADPESCLPPESIGPEPSPTPVVDTPPPLPPWIVDQWPTLPPLETPPPPDEGSVMGRILAMNEGEAQGDTGNMEEGGTVPQDQGIAPQDQPPSPNSNEANEAAKRLASGVHKWLRNKGANLRHAVISVGFGEDGTTYVSINQRRAVSGDLTDTTAQLLQQAAAEADGVQYVGPTSLAPKNMPFSQLLHAEDYILNVVGAGELTGLASWPLPFCSRCMARIAEEQPQILAGF